MNSDYLQKIEQKFYKTGRDKFAPGDTVKVHTKIEEGDKTRTQIFRGVVIAIKGSGVSQTFTVRKISYGVGVEKIFPTHSPMVEKVELEKKGNSRGSKLYHLRKRIGNKALQVKDGREINESDLYVDLDVPVEGTAEEANAENVVAAEVIVEEAPAAEASVDASKASEKTEEKAA